ncbi:hypothetical protein NDU88_004949 [Pleurodeles waltl]|uniref:Uncharacterized protein n=1 Tax=Pleurodeles waltl TaxID=8319 RepID=A0AAV7PH50_PLEWA|nr:hypothetical protein NDU88_004949 [Pleurodeles waltl]
MEDYGSPSLFSPEVNQEVTEVWAKFMAMGQAKGLEWARKMLAMRGEQQAATPARTDTDGVQPSDSGLGAQSHKSSRLLAKKERPTKATADGKAKRNNKDGVDHELAGPRQPPKKRSSKDSEEHNTVTADIVPVTGGGPDPQNSTPVAKGLTSQPTQKEAPSLTPGALGQGLQDGLSKMMEAMHSFMASARVLVGLGMDGQGASSKQAGASKVWGQGSSQPPKAQGKSFSLGT